MSSAQRGDGDGDALGTPQSELSSSASDSSAFISGRGVAISVPWAHSFAGCSPKAREVDVGMPKPASTSSRGDCGLDATGRSDMRPSVCATIADVRAGVKSRTLVEAGELFAAASSLFSLLLSPDSDSLSDMTMTALGLGFSCLTRTGSEGGVSLRSELLVRDMTLPPQGSD